MSPDDSWKAFERLADALAADLIAMEDEEVLASHPGRGARVQADALRQALSRGAASAPPDDVPPRDMLRRLTMRPQREHKR